MARDGTPSGAAPVAAALATALLACALLATSAAAHTHLASTTPSDGSRARLAPAAVVLHFTRPVVARTAIVRVVDERGRSLAVAAIAGDGRVVRAGLPRPLADGEYAVGYRVLASDGHAMSGGIAFTVAASPAGATGATRTRGSSQGADATRATRTRGSSQGAGATGAARTRGFAQDARASAARLREAVPRDAAWTRPALVAARAGQYTGLVLALGGVTFLLLAWWPALAAAGAPRRDPAERTWRRTLRIAVAIGGATAAGGLVAHAFDAAGAQPTAARALAGLRDPAALLWIEATACWVVAAVLLHRGARLAPRESKRLLAPLAGALLATALSGHGGSDGQLTAIAASIVHGTAATMWIGALAWLMLAARGAGARRRARAQILPGAAARVSRLSLAAALATLASGTIQAVALAGGPLTLPGSGYGRLVLAKLALFGGLVALGAVHRRRALPALRAAAPPTAGGRPLRAALRAELAIAALLLAAAGVLTGSAPPQPADAARVPAALAAGH